MAEAYVQSLDEDALRGLSLRLLEDLKEARERLRQNPHNSSRPPSSRAPWERPSTGDEEAIDAADPTDPADGGRGGAEAATTSPEEAPGTPEPPASGREAPASEKPKRQAGKQPGAPGVGRAPVLNAHERSSASSPCPVRPADSRA